MKLVERAVIACFLRHAEKICLLKRSQAVASAQGRWHCITGFVDAGVEPLDQALAEIGEETGLAGDTIRLVAAASPIRVERPAQGWVWIIHPFLFDATTTELTLDWEHDEYRWISPDDLASSECVAWVSLVWSALSS
ncbi:MAG: NUDIX domain-containing protein [Chloroflexi bacterium]|nr:NUDIX domain-containing protein [Chloroflexota bacterium]